MCIYIKAYIHKNVFGNRMGRINLIVPDDFEERFRKEIFKRMGMRKGNLTKAIIEAMEMWMMHPDEEVKKIDLSSTSLKKERSTEEIVDEDAINRLLDIVADESVPLHMREKALEKLQKLVETE